MGSENELQKAAGLTKDDIATGIAGLWENAWMDPDCRPGPDDVANAVVELIRADIAPHIESALLDRIEELIEVVKGIDETVGSFGYSLGLLNVEGSAGDLEDLEMVLDEAEKLADRARSLLVPKEEA